MGYARLPCCAVLEYHRGHDDTTRAHFNSPKLNDYFLLVSFWLRDKGVKSKEKERKEKKKKVEQVETSSSAERSSLYYDCALILVMLKAASFSGDPLHSSLAQSCLLTPPRHLSSDREK